MNTLPMRVELVPDATARSWLNTIHRATAERFDHEETPLPAILRAAGLLPGESLFDTVLSIENYPYIDRVVDATLPGINVAYEGASEATSYAIAASVPPAGALLKITYDLGSVDSATAQELLTAWGAMTDRLAAATDETSVAEIAFDGRRPSAFQPLPLEPGPRREPPTHAQTATQELVADVWRAVLERDEIGIHDNFFDIGGTSLSMFTLLRGARAATGLPLKMVDLFAHPTIASLAAFVENAAVDVALLPTRARTRVEELARRRAKRQSPADIGSVPGDVQAREAAGDRQRIRLDTSAGIEPQSVQAAAKGSQRTRNVETHKLGTDAGVNAAPERDVSACKVPTRIEPKR